MFTLLRQSFLRAICKAGSSSATDATFSHLSNNNLLLLRHPGRRQSRLARGCDSQCATNRKNGDPALRGGCETSGNE